MIHFSFIFSAQRAPGAQSKSDRITVVLPHAPGTAPSGTTPGPACTPLYSRRCAPLWTGGRLFTFFGARVRTPYKNTPLIFVRDTLFRSFGGFLSVKWLPYKKTKSTENPIGSDFSPGGGPGGSTPRVEPPFFPFFIYIFISSKKYVLSVFLYVSHLHWENRRNSEIACHVQNLSLIFVRFYRPPPPKENAFFFFPSAAQRSRYKPLTVLTVFLYGPTPGYSPTSMFLNVVFPRGLA